MLCSNYEAELFERVTADLHTYVELFNPMKEKISKRRRKLLDYDNAKHSYESAANAKRPDELKVAKVSYGVLICAFNHSSFFGHLGI